MHLPFLNLLWLTHFSHEVTVVPVFLSNMQQKQGKYKQDTNGVHFYVKCHIVRYCFCVQMNDESLNDDPFEAILFSNLPLFIKYSLCIQLLIKGGRGDYSIAK